MEKLVFRHFRHMFLAALAAAPLALASLATTAVAQPATQPAAAPTASSSTPLVSDPDYALGEGDVIDVLVVGSADFNTRARVSSDGVVLLPLLGPVPAAGSSPMVLAERIAEGLKKGGYFASPLVRVELVGIRSRYVTVLGQVGSPGLIPLDRTYRLSEIMAKVGGRTAGGANYVVVTPRSGESKQYEMEKLATGGTEDDPIVLSGDKIFVPAAENEVVYISGEVRSPGAIPVVKDMSVRIALARAGGVGENGSEKRLKIIRNGEKLPKVDLETKLQPGDIVTVGARLF